ERLLRRPSEVSDATVTNILSPPPPAPHAHLAAITLSAVAWTDLVIETSATDSSRQFALARGTLTRHAASRLTGFDLGAALFTAPQRAKSNSTSPDTAYASASTKRLHSRSATVAASSGSSQRSVRNTWSSLRTWTSQHEGRGQMRTQRNLPD